jgi:hypothetical protein
MPFYPNEEILGFSTLDGRTLCADCYYETFEKYRMGDQVITTEESEDGLAICDQCLEQI